MAKFTIWVKAKASDDFWTQDSLISVSAGGPNFSGGGVRYTLKPGNGWDLIRADVEMPPGGRSVQVMISVGEGKGTVCITDISINK